MIEEAIEAVAPEVKVAKTLWKFAPYIAIALLIGALLWLRADKIKAEGQRDKAQTQVTALTGANKSLNDALTVVKQERVDNDKIAEAVAAKLNGNSLREDRTREAMKEAISNDPQTRNWAANPVPVGVRNALRAGTVEPPAR